MSERKRRGRPLTEADDIPARVHITVPGKLYDQALLKADQDGVSVPELARRALTRLLSDEPPTTE